MQNLVKADRSQKALDSHLPTGKKQITAVQVMRPGDITELQAIELELADPAPDEVQVRNHACGVNYIDIYQRTGLYPMPMPAILGGEAAGVIERCGVNVTDYAVGDEVAYCTAGVGCYVSHRNIPATKAIPLPAEFSTKVAAGVMLKGLTAEYLARRSWPVLAGMDVLVTAAAGGVGMLLCQWLARLGATVIGVVGSKAKCERALSYGCTEVLVGYENLGDRVGKLRPQGVAVAYDSVGAATWPAILDALTPRGCLVSYGNASGPVPPFAPLELASRGSLYVTRPTLAHYTTTRTELLAAAAALFNEIKRGLVLPQVLSYPLTEAAAAHKTLASRELEGVLVLQPAVT